MFEIKKGIPVPDLTQRKGNTRYPFKEMEVGDCFDAKRDGEFHFFGPNKAYKKDRMQHRILTAAKHHAKKNGAKFIAHCVDENTVRCWRTA